MPRDKTATHERIIRAMREEFLTQGYEKASLNRVSAKVGITTAGLYKHFKGKEDMFYFLVKDTLDDFRKLASSEEHTMKTAETYDPFDEDWPAIWTDFIYTHYEGMKLLICCSEGSRFASFEDEFIARETEGNKAYAEVLRQEGKDPKPLSDMQWHLLSTAYVHLILETVRHDMTREEAAEHLRFTGDLLYPGWKAIFGLETE